MKTIASTPALRRHPMWSQADFAYLRAKGYSNAEVQAFWDRDHKAGLKAITKPDEKLTSYARTVTVR